MITSAKASAHCKLLKLKGNIYSTKQLRHFLSVGFLSAGMIEFEHRESCIDFTNTSWKMLIGSFKLPMIVKIVPDRKQILGPPEMLEEFEYTLQLARSSGPEYLKIKYTTYVTVYARTKPKSHDMFITYKPLIS